LFASKILATQKTSLQGWICCKNHT